MSHILFMFVSENKTRFQQLCWKNYGGIYAGYQEKPFLKASAVAVVVTSTCLCGVIGCSAFIMAGHTPDIEPKAVVLQSQRSSG